MKVGRLIVVRHGARETEFLCRICKAEFTKDETSAFERHVNACYAANEAELRGKSLREKAPGIFDPERSGDVELGKWIKRHRDALLEDRKKL